MFLVHHIDSIIQVVLGLFFTWSGFRQSAPSSWRTTVFRVGGPALIAVGGLLLFMSNAGAR